MALLAPKRQHPWEHNLRAAHLTVCRPVSSNRSSDFPTSTFTLRRSVARFKASLNQSLSKHLDRRQTLRAGTHTVLNKKARPCRPWKACVVVACVNDNKLRTFKYELRFQWLLVPRCSRVCARAFDTNCAWSVACVRQWQQEYTLHRPDSVDSAWSDGCLRRQNMRAR